MPKNANRGIVEMKSRYKNIVVNMQFVNYWYVTVYRIIILIFGMEQLNSPIHEFFDNLDDIIKVAKTSS